jgi:hypothetical protein
VTTNSHVDIVHTQWSAGTQSVEARVSVVDGRVRFRGVLAAQWRQKLVGGYAESGLSDPADGPEEFVAALHDHLATLPHDRGECPFGTKQIVQMSTPVPPGGAPFQQADHCSDHFRGSTRGHY